jgi:hypothetical protein
MLSERPLNAGLRDFSWLKLAGLFVLISFVLALRFPSPLANPRTFAAEEGSVYFQDAHNLPFRQAIFSPYAGYYNLASRLLAEACVWLPYRVFPFVYSFLALLAASASLSFFYLPFFRRIVRRDWQRLAICLGLCAAPNAQPLLRLDSIHFYLVVFLTLVAVMDLPAGLPGKALVFLLAALSAWSAPMAIVLVPVFLYRAIKRGTTLADRAVWLLIVLAFAGFTIAVRRMGQPISTGLASVPGVYWHALAYRVSAEGLIGEKAAWRLGSAYGWYGFLPFLLLVLLLGGVGLVRDRRSGYSLFPGLALLYAVFATPVLIAFRPDFATAFVKFTPGLPYWQHDRYFLAATLTLFLYLGLRWSRMRGPAKLELAVNILVACWLCSLYLWGYHFYPTPDSAPRFAAYVPLIERTEREAAADGKIHKLFIPIFPQPWFVVLQVGKRTGTQSPQDVVPMQMRFTDYFSLAADESTRPGWRHSSWFGTFDDSRYPWIYSPDYGWMACLEPNIGGIWLWSVEQGAFWTGPLYFPSVYDFRKNEWIKLPREPGR